MLNWPDRFELSKHSNCVYFTVWIWCARKTAPKLYQREKIHQHMFTIYIQLKIIGSNHMDLKLLNEWEKIERQQHNSHWFVQFKCSDDEIESRWKICWIFYCGCLFSCKIREIIAKLAKLTAIRGFTKLKRQCKANGIQISQCIPFILCNQLFIACSQQLSRQLLYIVDCKVVSFVDFVSNYKPSSPK